MEEEEKKEAARFWDKRISLEIEQMFNELADPDIIGQEDLENLRVEQIERQETCDMLKMYRIGRKNNNKHERPSKEQGENDPDSKRDLQAESSDSIPMQSSIQ